MKDPTLAQLQEQIRRLEERNRELEQKNARLRSEQPRQNRLLEEMNVILDLLPAGVGVSFDPECRDVIINESGIKLLGSAITKEREAYGYRISPSGESWEVYDEDGRRLAVEDLPMQKAARTGEHINHHLLKMVPPEGETIYHRITARPLLDEDGKPRGSVCAFSDVTELQQILADRERSVRRQKLLTRIIFQAYQQGNLSETLHLATAECAAALNGDFAKILEYRPDQDDFLLRSNYNFADAVVDETVLPGGNRSQAGYTIEQPEPVLVEDLTKDPRFDGPQLLISNGVQSGISAVIPGGDGHAFGVVGVHSKEPRVWTREDAEFLRDLAVLLGVAVEKERRVEALRRSEAHFRLMTEGMPQMVFVAAPDGRTLWHNQQWEDFSGLPRDEQRGEGWKQLVHPEDLPKVNQAGRRAKETGETFEEEYRLRDRHGVYRWHLVRAVAVRDGRGQIERWFGSATDIEDRKQIENDLRELDRRKDQFLAMLGHELRNPLAAVRNSIFIVRSGAADEEQTEECLEIIERQANNLGRLVDDLLDITRINSGRIKLDFEDLDWRDVIQSVTRDYRGFLEDKSLQLKLDLPDDPMPVSGDALRLSQALGNLVHNACKFSQPHQDIDIVASLHEEDKTARVLVRDFGEGMGEETMQNLFEAFPHRKKIYRAGQAGLGLGLIVVKNLIELHGGRILAESRGRDRGSEFTLILPLCDHDDSAPALPESDLSDVEGDRVGGERSGEPAEDQRRAELREPHRILLVEDDDSTARSLSMILVLENQEVRTAANLREAKRLARDWNPQIVISDIQLPDGSGIELVECLKDELGLPQTRYIALSGFSAEKVRRQALQAGFDTYLIKPPEQEILFAACFEPL